MHDLNRKKGKLCLMSLKINMDKVYDRVHISLLQIEQEAELAD